MSQIAIAPSEPALLKRIQHLAIELLLPFYPSMQTAYAAGCDYVLLQTASHLALQHRLQPKLKPLWLDFASNQYLKRIKHASRRTELLLRAMGNVKRANTQILDATAGLGQDSFLLASVGYSVLLIERDPVLYALLRDGLARAQVSPKLALIIKRMQLTLGNSYDYLQQLQHTQHDIIYLDPMFPASHTRALAKKNMQLLQGLLKHAENNSQELFEMALTCARNRVVVKRPRHGTAICQHITPDLVLTGNSCRFDIYLTGNS